MKAKYIFLIIVVFITGCKKKVNDNSSYFIPYFSDTSETKLTGATITSPELMDSITLITEADSADFPSFNRIMSPDRYEIFTPRSGNQEDRNSCVGWALGYGLLSHYQLLLNGQLTYNYYDSIYSPTFVYNFVNGGQDTGMSLGVGLKVLKNKGSCKWNTMNGTVLPNQFPSNSALLEAASYKVTNFSRMLYTENRVKFYLARNYALPFGAFVDKGFKSGKFKNAFRKTSDGRLVWNQYQDTERTGHAMLLCGYDDNIRAYKVLNSWGENWGNNGFVWIDYDFFSQVLAGTSPRHELFIATIPRRLSIPNGLIAHFPFNGNAQDQSGNSNHGTVYGASLVSDRKGHVNKAYSFNGINSYIEIPNSPGLNLTGDISISAWINCTDLSQSQRIFDKTTVSNSDAFMLDIHPANQLRFIVANPPAGANPPQSNAVLNQNNTWYHVVAAYDGSKVSFFVNGAKINDFPITGTSTINNNPIRIGANSNLNGTWFNGKIDDIRLYNRAINADEVLLLYNE